MGKIIEIIFLIVLLLIIFINYILYRKATILKEKSNSFNLSGFEVARNLANSFNSDVHIIKKKGRFLDHYNLERNVIKLSPEVFDETNLYATDMAIIITLEIAKTSVNKANRFTAFMVIFSYLLIILGAFINNATVMHFGFLIFIIAFLFSVLIISLLIKDQQELENIFKIINSKKIANLDEDNKNNILSLLIIHLARLPYSFINYFR